MRRTILQAAVVVALASGALAVRVHANDDGGDPFPESSFGSVQYSPGVWITGTPEFRDYVAAILDQSRASGNGLLDRIDAAAVRGVTTTYMEGTPGTGNNAMAVDGAAAQPTRATVDPATGRVVVVEAGAGSSTIIMLDMSTADAPCQNMRGAIDHETAHAADSAEGQNLASFSWFDAVGEAWTSHEEARATGLGPYTGDPDTENATRIAEGVDPRNTYTSICPVTVEPDTVGTGSSEGSGETSHEESGTFFDIVLYENDPPLPQDFTWSDPIVTAIEMESGLGGFDFGGGGGGACFDELESD